MEIRLIIQAEAEWNSVWLCKSVCVYFYVCVWVYRYVEYKLLRFRDAGGCFTNSDGPSDRGRIIVAMNK